MQVSLSVIIPTLGRPSLQATLDSLVPQLHPADELTVVADGCRPNARRHARAARAQTEAMVRYAEVSVPGSQFGNGQRDLGMEFATGSHLLFIDDDDVYEPDALSLIRAAVEARPHAVHVFKATWGQGHHAHGVTLWRAREFREQNIATPMCVWPRSDRLPKWMEFNGAGIVSDFGWMGAALGVSRLEWHESVIATVRPVRA